MKSNEICAKMTQDVEMKDNNTPSQSIISSSTSTMQSKSRSECFNSRTVFIIAKFLLGFDALFLCFPDLKEIAALIDTGSYTKEVRRIARAVRLTIGLRQKLTGSVLSSFLDFALVPGSEAHSRLSSFVPKVFVGFTSSL